MPLLILNYLFVNHNIKLLDTFKSELLFLDEDTHWISHEFECDIKHFLWHGSREQDYLNVVRHLGEYVVDLLLEASRQHLVGLIENEQFNILRVLNYV